MRSRALKWIALCLLIAAGAWLLWRAGNSRVAEKKSARVISTFVHSSSTAPAFLAGATTATNANQAGAVETNRFAYRLTNTAKSIGELVNDRHAILLENALIDTGSPLNFSIPAQLRAQGDPGAYIVQARGPINAAFRALLARAGAGIVAYIPNDAYLVRVPATGASLLAAQPPVQSVIPYEPYYKISATMPVTLQPRSFSAASVATNWVAGPSLLVYAVKQAPLPAGTYLTLGLFGDGASATVAQIEKLGARIVGRDQSPFGPVVRVQPPADWVALAALPGVQIVEPFRPRVHANDLSRVSLGVSADTLTPTNYLNLYGSNVMVAVADSGIDATHPDFTTGGSPATGQGGNPVRVVGLTTNDLVDTDGHGTFVAGQIAGNGDESWGVNGSPQVNVGSVAQGSVSNADFRGKAPLATLFSMNFNDSDEQLQEAAALTNALISNNSWNYSGDNAYDLEAASYDWATRDALAGVPGSQPVLFVFSAGNGGQLNNDNGGGGGGNNDGTGGNPDTIFSPATAKNVITVGALEQFRDITTTNAVTNADGTINTDWQQESDSSSQVAGFSSRGNVGIGIEGQFGRFKPDVVAPGTFVVSTRSSQWATNAYYNPTNDNVTTLSDLLQPHTQTDPPLQFFVFNNAIGVTIRATLPNGSPFMPLPINVWQGTDPYTTAPTVGPINDLITIPPDGALSPLNTIWQCAVTNMTAFNLSYTLTADVQTTNGYGNYYQVLQGLNDSLGQYYRYESGTSMSAADVSGVLALMQDYFMHDTSDTNPSPALLKALLINGSRATGSYNFQVDNPINYEGWGQIGLPDSLPAGLTNQTDIACDSFYSDQSPTNALATGDSHSYLVTLDTNAADFAQYLPLQVTLAWTDPPGDPAAALKLVNNLVLVVSNVDTGDTYFGNDIPAGSIYNNVWSTNALAATNAADLEDSINNVQQVILPPLLAGSYTVTVIGRGVNVNAVTQQTNNVVQDYALVIACGEGEVATAITVTDNGIISNPTGDQNLTFVMATNNTPLMNQLAGANTPLLGTNQIPIGTNTIWGTNGLITLGMTNQWHFYVVTNPVSNPSDYTNAAFITFLSETLSIPREGVFADSVTNATRPEADIDLYVAGPNDPNASALINLDPAEIANCINGVNGDAASLGRGGTEFVIYSNSAPGDVYYIGVKSEDHMAAEFDFIPIFTRIPFGGLDANGNQVVNGLNVPVNIPNGSPANPQSAYVFAVAPQEMTIQRVIVTNTILHQNFGNLVGVLSHGYNGSGETAVTLNQHNEPASPPPPGPYTMVYDDSGQGDIIGSQHSDGPGSLNNYVSQEALGVWILTETDNALTQTGSVQNFTLLIQPHVPLTSGSTNIVQPHSWFYDYVDVPPGYTNLSIFGTNLPPVAPPSFQLQMYLNVTNPPNFLTYLYEADLTNSPPGQPPYPAGLNPGNSISYGPPLQPARYWVGVYNPDSVAHAVYLLATLGGSLAPVPPTGYPTAGPSILDDAVTGNSTTISNTQLIASVNVGIVVAHPRISDLTFTLVSPTGQSVLLMENRGDDSTNGAGEDFVYTNVLNTTANGGAAPSTNYLQVSPLGGTVPITYNFYTVPDEMTVYSGTNDANFYLGSPNLLWDTGFTNNPPLPGGGANNTQPVTIDVPVPPGYTNITIIMNQFGNPYASGGGDAWIYTAGAAVTNYEYLMFTEDTNLATIPIKFAIPPYNFAEEATNYTLSDFELATNGNYRGPTNIYDPFGGWFVPTNKIVGTNSVLWTNNLVSVVTDPYDSLGDHVGSNFLALADGTITRSIATVPGRQYNVTFWYRGPGISGWWRGEGDASDSSQPEGGNNGSLIGRFNFPAGEVGQAFEFEDAGQAMEFAGTNTYVQVRQSPSLDVGAGGGLTVEGWINPTNLSRQMPLVEWLAKVPVFTNSADTNFSIVAGPFLNPATDHYYYLLAATNWTTSENWATNLGGHLVTIDSANKQNWVYDTFANFGNTNRNLWIGLTNNLPPPGTFGWSGGLTDIVYTNWANAQPDNSCGTANYTFMLGNTNTPGLWTLANNNGFTCANPAKTNQIFGVVEVDNLQTNGVQFWISVTNTPGTTNGIFDSVGNLYTNGCLYANLVDVSNLSHEIYSAPGLIQSNIFQYVALTYDTNSGIAMLYYNGTNVATTNMGVFVPKTGGDVLLGKDMSLATNNYYGGKMDEMSIYSRALSGAEIAAIYQVTASATNGLTGKFDPTVTPAFGLAEAQVAFGTTTNIIYGVNNKWELNSFTFTATTNGMPLQISGLEPGILLDDFAVSETPLTNLYYLPEQSLNELIGDSPNGTWTLQIWDNRANAAVTAADAQLLNWELQFVLQTNVLGTPVPAAPESPTTVTVPPGQIVYLSVPVPAWAFFATNILDSASGPVDLLFNPTNEPTGANPGDLTLLTGSTGGVGAPVLTVNTPYPLQQPYDAAQSYYLGIRNNGAHAVTATVEVDFDITTLSNGVPVSDVLNTTNHVERYFAFDVSSNAFEATFQLLHLSGNADLVVSKAPSLPTLLNSDYGSFNVSNLDENIYLFTNSAPVPLSAGRWYLGVFNRDTGPVNYTVLAKELDATNGTPGYTVINLTNRVPFNFTAGPGAALTNFFLFNVTNTFFVVTNAANGFGTNTVTTNTLASIHFELYNLSGNGDLTVQTDAPPFGPPFFESSQQPGEAPELIVIRTNSVLTNLVAQWYLGVPNNETNPINYTIVAALDTNIVFPAFPGAEGAGADAIGGRFGGVYHVTSLGDSGPGTLRDAVSATNRTVVFDVSGTINLLSPLVITNSFLTIAGQTAPGDGITVAGNMTVVQSANNVVIRYVRFRLVTSVSDPVVVWFNGFEGGGPGNYSASAGTYFAGGWHVEGPGYIDVLGNGTFGLKSYSGNYCIDLNGSSPSGISTNIATVAGITYTLNFAYARNPDSIGFGVVPQAAVVLNGNPLAIITANQVNSWPNLGWQTASYTFTATSPSTHLAFISTNTPGASDVLLDAVSMSTNLAMNYNPGDSLQMTNVSDVVVDHVSTSWSTNNDLSVLNSTNVTVQWSMMADSIYAPAHPHGYGSRLRYGNGALTFHHNLYADNYNANPRLGDNLTLDFVNNVIYNWGIYGGFSTNESVLDDPFGFTNQLNYACNYLIAGPNSVMTNIAFWSGTPNTWIFQTNNFMDSNTNGILDGADTGWFMFTNHYTPVQVPFPPLAVSIDEAFLAYERVLDFAGVAMDKRDAVDTNIVTGVRDQTGVIIATPGALPALNFTLAYLDSDRDGIPDFWETTLGEYPTNFSANYDRDGDGYTDLEEYLNWLAGPHALTVTNTPVNVDLLQMFGKTGDLSFSVTNAVQGFVYLTNVLNYTNSLRVVTSFTNTGPFSNSIAVFTPTNNLPFTNDYSGYASFDVFVTNNNTIAYFGPVTVSVMVSAVPITYAGNTNTPPVLSTNIPNQTVNELMLLTVTNTATDANTNLTLTYTVTMIVDTNAMIASNWPTMYASTTPSPVIDANGIITWTPSEAQGPGVYTINTVVTDNGIPPLSATNSFTVIVNETNAAPVLPVQANQTINELTTLTVTNTASDSDIPTNALTYTVMMSIDTNAMIASNWPTIYATTNPSPVIDTNGVITWTPSEAQGPGVYLVTTVVTDTNIYALANRSLSATNSFTVTVNEVNTAPFWPTNVPSQTNYIVNVLTPLFVINTATDSDIPPNPLTYQLIGPPGAMIDANGIITWAPTLAQTPGFYIFTTIVTDTNVYALTNRSLSATNSFTVTVVSVFAPFVFTQPATSVTGTNAQLNGMATPNGLPTTAWFQWGTNMLYGNQTPPVSVGAGFNVVYAPSPISGLVTNVAYHFRLVASNALGVVYGFDQILDEANVVVWGDNFVGQLNVPPGLSNVVAIAGAYDHSLALKNNGTAVTWGDNLHTAALAVPAGLNNLVAVAGGESYSLALKNSGTVVAWGVNTFPGETNVPPGLNNVVTIASGTYSSLALQNNGAVVAWGPSIFAFGLTNVPAGLSNVVAIAGGGLHSLAIKNDGTVVAWGYNANGQTNVPVNLNNVVAIAAGDAHSLALKYDGTVVAWGEDSDGQTDVPPGLTNVVAIAAGGFNSLALKNDGSIVVWGFNSFGQTSVPVGLTNAVAISAGYLHSLALTPQSISSLINPVVLGITNGVPQTNSIFAGGIVFYRVNVPANADFATNSLLYTLNGPLNVWFTTNTPPTIANVNDSLLFSAATNGVSILSTTSMPTNIVPGSMYYLGVQNTNTFAVTYGIEVDFHLVTPPPLVISSIIYTNGGFLLTWFAPSNDLFQVQWTGSLPPVSWTSFTNIVSYNTNAFTSPSNTQFNYFDDGSQFPFGLTRFYRLILLQGVPTNGVPLTNSVPAGGVDSYLIYVPTNADFATNLLLSATAPLNVWFDTNAPSTTNVLLISGTNGYYTLSTTGTPPLVPGSTYYLSVQNTNSVAVNYGIEVDFHLVTSTNLGPVLPAQTNRVINPLSPLVVTNTATDAAVPAPVLTYTLTSTVAGTNQPVINATNGVITWTPDASQAGTSNVLTTMVTAGGAPPLSATNRFAVVVNPLPVLNRVVYTNGGFLLTWYAPTNDIFQVQFTDSLSPINWQSFSNIITYSGPPTPTNGLFTFFDDGSQYPFTGVRFYQLILLGVATPAQPGPVLPAQTNRVINPLSPLVVTNTASDAAVPAPVLTYTLTSTVMGTNQPVINATNGVITWTPDAGQSGTSNVLTTMVTAGGVPALSATNRFAVVVNPLPALGSVVYTNGGFLLTWYAPTNDIFQVQFTDSLSPINWQSFSNIITYSGPPTPTNGLFSFFDDGSQYPFTGVRFYQLILLGVATPAQPGPVLPLQTNHVINPLSPLVVTNSASDAAVPAPVLTYTLTSTVAGTNQPVINATNGVITWTPDAGQSGTSNVLATVVTASGAPPLSATNSFAVVVNPLPALGSVVYTNGGFLLTWYAPTNDIFQVQFTDSLSPINWQSFSNIITYSGPPTPTNGLFSFFDDGSQYPFTGVRFYQLILLGVATPAQPGPVLPAQTNRVINPLSPLVVTNTASDAAVPAPVLTYTLTSTVMGTNQPVINATNGVITWTPDAGQSGTSNVLTTMVTAGGAPPLSATNRFAVVVNPLPVLNRVVYTNGGFLLTWYAPTNDIFQVQFTDSLSPINWQSFSNIITYSGPPTPTNGQFMFFDDGSQYPFTGVRFYQLILLGVATPAQPGPMLPMQADRVINPLSPLVVTNTASDAAVPAPVLTYTLTSTVMGTNQPVINATNGVITWTPDAGQSGTSNVLTTMVTAGGAPPLSATNSFAVVVNPLPVISSITITNNALNLIWFAPTNDQFEVEWTTNLAPIIVWTPFPGIITSTNGIFTFMDTNTPLILKFYNLLLLP